MIGLWTGVPRCGKTYSLVYRITQKYCVKFGDTYRLKDEYVLITDIDGLQIEHLSLIDFIREDQELTHTLTYVCPKCKSNLILKDGPYGKFFSCSGYPTCKFSVSQEKAESLQKNINSSDPSRDLNIKKLFSDSGFKSLRDKYPEKKIVIIIDECQRYFHSKLYDREIFYAFEYHGHYGIDIYLIAHNITKIPREIANCLEFETRLIPRRYALPGYFWYNEKQGFDVVGRGKVPKRQEIFDLYTSEHFSQGDKVHKSFTKYYIGLITLIIFASTFLFRFIYQWSNPENKKKSNISSSSISSPKTAHINRGNIPYADKKSDLVESKDIASNKNSVLYTTEDYEYYPIPSSVTYSKLSSPIISVVHNGEMVPISLYPRKVIIITNKGTVKVFELRKKEQKQNKPENFISFTETKPETPFSSPKPIEHPQTEAEKKTTVDSEISS
jgi:ssDNA-binding Zn-finger/Zn-ribbon topoisomerase 1